MMEQEPTARIVELIEHFESSDARVREMAQDLTAALLELYGAGFKHIIEALTVLDAGLVRRLADDKRIGALLLLHGLHPGTGKPASNFVPLASLRTNVP